jgi:hypothetical protein
MTVGVVDDRPVVAIGPDAYPIRELAAGAQRAVLQDVDGNADHHLEPVQRTKSERRRAGAGGHVPAHGQQAGRIRAAKLTLSTTDLVQVSTESESGRSAQDRKARGELSAVQHHGTRPSDRDRTAALQVPAIDHCPAHKLYGGAAAIGFPPCRY